MKLVPDSVCSPVLSRISLRNWTCGAISEPNAAVAIRQPPPGGSGDSDSVTLTGVSNSTPRYSDLLFVIEKIKSWLLTEESVPKRYLPSILPFEFEVKNHPPSCRSAEERIDDIKPPFTLLTL